MMNTKERLCMDWAVSRSSDWMLVRPRNWSRIKANRLLRVTCLANKNWTTKGQKTKLDRSVFKIEWSGENLQLCALSEITSYTHTQPPRLSFKYSKYKIATCTRPSALVFRHQSGIADNSQFWVPGEYTLYLDIRQFQERIMGFWGGEEEVKSFWKHQKRKLKKK